MYSSEAISWWKEISAATTWVNTLRMCYRKEAASEDMHDSVYKVSRTSKSIETERWVLWDRRKWGD